MKFEDFWYAIALSPKLKPNAVISRTVLGEWLAIFRDKKGKAVALQDRCLHRNSRLSCGQVNRGQLICPYHGWRYNEIGEVVAVPSEGEQFKLQLTRRVQRYETCERDGYVYVRLTENPSENFSPFPMPYYQQPGWETARVINRFRNTVTNCAENFIDIPHTASVHPGIFRTARQQALKMTVRRDGGSVLVSYENETNNLGWYAKFLNPGGGEIQHTDSFHMPNVTSVEYNAGKHRRLFITSQSIPETNDSTLVYTDVTYNYGIWNKLARPFVYWTAQKIIAQDVKALAIQGETIAKYGQHFSNTPADTIHVFVESIIARIEKGEDPRQLKPLSVEVKFWV